MQIQSALAPGAAVDAATQGEAGLAQGPGDRIAGIQVGGFTPGNPVQDAAVSVQCQNPGQITGLVRGMTGNGGGIKFGCLE